MHFNYLATVLSIYHTVALTESRRLLDERVLGWDLALPDEHNNLVQ
jgi:hypothetical protein